MTITERQKDIINKIVRAYIKSAKPVSSKLIEKKYGFNICPATIRIEMQKLTDMGYLMQPHTSAGRIPTDKGYRFYVDNSEQKKKGMKMDGELSLIEKEIDDSFKFFQDLTKRVAELSSNLALTYFPEEDILFKEGWDHIFKEPEFEDADFISRFTEMVENMGENIEDLTDFDFPQIFIGKENQLPGAQDFSTVVSNVVFAKKKKGIVAILGPKRMDYNKNVEIINSLNKVCQTKNPLFTHRKTKK